MEEVEFARGALGQEEERLDQIASGLLEVSMSDTRSAGSLNPFIFGAGLPFLFSTHASLDAALERGNRMEQINAGTTPEGVRVVAMVANGGPAGLFNTKKAINTTDDLGDLRMRALDETQIRMYEALGSTGTIVFSKCAICHRAQRRLLCPCAHSRCRAVCGSSCLVLL